MVGEDGEQKGSITLVALGLIGALVLMLVVLVAGTAEDDCGGQSTDAGGGVGVSSEGTAPPTKPGTTSISSGYRTPSRPDHEGVDYAGPAGTPIYAFADGRVVAAGPATGFGNWIVVDHNIGGRVWSSVYGHEETDGVLVKVGDQVKAGQQIGKIGSAGYSTGPHLHFELWDGGRLTGGHTVDPAPLVKKAEEGGGAPAPAGPAQPSTPAPAGGGVAGLNGRQAALAKLTVAIGERMAIPERGIIIALAVESRESSFRNLANDGTYSGPDTMPATPEELRRSLTFPHDGVGHDHASVGPFQQQVNYWGTVPELMEPVTANKKFYQGLKKLPGWEQMPVTVAAQKVQQSATPDAYAEHETLGRALYEAFKGAGKDLSDEDLRKLGTDGTAAVAGSADSCQDSGTGAIAGMVSFDPNDPFGKKVIAAASKWIGTRYSWGGGDFNGPTKGIPDPIGDQFGDSTHPGFDCSGLVRYAVYQASGGKTRMTRTTETQVKEGQGVPFDQKQPGDIIYFGSPPHHTGIYYGKQNGQDMLLNAPQSGQNIAIMPLSNWSGEAMTVRRMG